MRLNESEVAHFPFSVVAVRLFKVLGKALGERDPVLQETPSQNFTTIAPNFYNPAA